MQLLKLKTDSRFVRRNLLQGLPISHYAQLTI